MSGIKYAVVHPLADRFHQLFHKLPKADTIFEAQPVKEAFAFCAGIEDGIAIVPYSFLLFLRQCADRFFTFDNYLGSVNPGRLTIFDVIMFMSAVVVAASYDQNDSSLDLVQILISLVIGVFFISMIVSCRKKYYDDIVRCMADYEFAESKKDKKIA